MPEPFGSVTKTKILKSESHKLFQEFEVDALKGTITFGGDLVTSNVINGKINGVAITAVTFTTDHDNTMDLLVAELESHPAVASASLTDAVNNRQVTIVATDPDNVFVLSDWAVTGGAGQASTTTATDTNNVYVGLPVKLTADGKVEPAGAAADPKDVIGICMHNGVGGDLVTVAMKSYMVTWCEAGTASLVAGPVKLHTTVYNTTSGYVEVDDASVTYANIFGWALDSATNVGDTVRVAVFA